jgi:hypothetical protein
MGRQWFYSFRLLLVGWILDAGGNKGDWKTMVHQRETFMHDLRLAAPKIFASPRLQSKISRERHHNALIRIGEGLAAFALLHHRAYGSVHGGSCSLS